MRKIGLILLALLVGPAWAAEEHGGGHSNGGKEEAPENATEYIQVDPPVVVNLQGRRRYLRADIQILVVGAQNIENIKLHMPAIRHALIMLFADRDPTQLAVVEEREKLRAETKEKITEVLEQYATSEGLQDVLFPSFLIQ